MRDGVLLSGVLHVFVLFFILVGIPWFWEPETRLMEATPVTVVSSDQLTAPKVKQEKKTEEKKEPPKVEIPVAPKAPPLPDPVVTPEPPTVTEDTQVEEPPKEKPNPEQQESVKPEEKDTPEPVIVEQPPEEPPPPEPVPVPTEQVAEAKDVPIPPQKPEPPKTTKVEKKPDEKKPKNDARDLGDLVNQLAETPETAAVPPQEEVPPDQPQTEGIPQRLPAGEEDALRSYIKTCWFSPGGSASPNELVVTIEIKLNRNATLLGAEVSRKDRSRMSDPVFRSFAERAKRAVDKCGADGQTFPVNMQRDYSLWGYMLVRFHESDFY